MNKTTLVLLGGCGFAILAAGYFLGSHRAPTERSPATDSSGSSAQLSALMEEVRALKRQTASLEIHSLNQVPAPSERLQEQDQEDELVEDTETEDHPALDDPSPEQLEERMASQEILDRAASRGVWTKEDADAFRHHVAGSGPEGNIDLMHQVADLLNSGDLKVDEGVRRPF